MQLHLFFKVLWLKNGTSTWGNLATYGLNCYSGAVKKKNVALPWFGQIYLEQLPVIQHTQARVWVRERMCVCVCMCSTRSCAPFIVWGVVPSSPLIPVLFKVKDVKDCCDGNSTAAEGMWPIIINAAQLVQSSPVFRCTSFLWIKFKTQSWALK